MNPRRRRMAAQAKLLQGIIAEHGRANDDSHKLQRGAVKCALTRSAANYALVTPRDLPWERTGKAKVTSKARFSEPAKVPAVSDNPANSLAASDVADLLRASRVAHGKRVRAWEKKWGMKIG